jgi:hypothetical protein
MRVKWNGESRRKPEVRAERPLGMVAPQIRDLDSGGALGIEVGQIRIADTGLILAARRAGSQLAASTAVRRTAAVVTSVSGS